MESFKQVGCPATILDANGRLLTMVYDGASNLLVKQYSDGTAVSMLYDPLNRMTTAIDWAGNTTFAYSKRSELIGKTDPGLLSQGYVFDSVSNKIVMIDPDNGFYTYSFDAVNRQVGLVDRYGGVSTAAFDANNRLTTMQSALGEIEISGSNRNGKLTTLIEMTPLLSPISTIVSTYDPGGRKVQDLINGVYATYLYDGKDRMIGQEKPGQYATFSFDPVGNILLNGIREIPRSP